VTGIEAEVDYLFHGPLGLQTRDITWKPEYRQAVATSIKTLKLLKRADSDLDINQFVTDKYIRVAAAQAGRDYDAGLKDYAQLPLRAKDAATGTEISDFSRVAQIWVKDEPHVRHYASPENALKTLAGLEKDGKTIRVVYAQDRESGIKLFANQAWFVRSQNGELNAFLLKDAAERWSRQHEVVLPDAAPSIVTGLAIGMGTSWFCLVTAEMISGQFGIGYYTWEAYTLQNYADIIVGMLIIGLLGMGSSWLLTTAGRLAMPWRNPKVAR
jgi:hypothetical protein